MLELAKMAASVHHHIQCGLAYGFHDVGFFFAPSLHKVCSKFSFLTNFRFLKAALFYKDTVKTKSTHKLKIPKF